MNTLPFNGTPPPWAPKRQRFKEHKHLRDAIALAETFSMNVPFNVQEFDVWASTRNLYTIPETVDKQSDAWKAMLQRRHELIQGINRAAETPDMHSQGGAYALVNEKGGKLQRISPDKHLAHPSLSMRKLNSLLTTKRAQLEHALRAEDFRLHNPYIKMQYVLLYKQIEHFEDDIRGRVDSLETNFYGLLEVTQAMALDPNFALPVGGYAQAQLEAATPQDTTNSDKDESFC